MNARQKVKQLKKKLEMYDYKTRPMHIEYTNYPTVHLRAEQIIPMEETIIPGCMDFYKGMVMCKLSSELEKYCEITSQPAEFIDEEEDTTITPYKRIVGDIWVVDRRIDK